LRYGIHAMVWAGGWSDADAERAISSAARIGYDILEIPVMNPAEFDAVHTKALLDKFNIKGGVSLGLAPDADISSLDSAKVRRGADVLHKALKHCATFGGDYFGGVIYSALTKFGAIPTEKGRANSVSVIRELAREAKTLGIILGIEAVNRYESNLLNTGAQVLRFIDDVGEDNVYVHLDTFHMNIEEADPVGAIELCRDRLGYFHVNENQRGYLGSGTIAFAPQFRALARIGYDKTIAFEAFSSSAAGGTLASMVAAWRDIWSDGDDIGKHALTFMKNEWEQAGRSCDLTTLGRRRRD
jgi:D-psicose/D-tagatose/L-ribulose 3-epimerase